MVLSVFSLLVAILLPAIQSARENARTLQCQNRLKQLVTAVHAHEAAHQAFPYTSNTFKEFENGEIVLKPAISPHVKLLPFLDLQNLSDRLDFKYHTFDRGGHPPVCYAVDPRTGGRDWNTKVNQKLLKTTVDIFLCPSDSHRPGSNNYRACMGYGVATFEKKNSRQQCEGSTRGAFVHDRETRVSEFRDGLANTAIFSEQLVGDGTSDVYTPWRDVYHTHVPHARVMCDPDSAARQCEQYARTDADHDSFVGTTWLFGGWRHGWYNHILTPNSEIPDCNVSGSQGGSWGAYAARSFHSGGVNVAMGDGSVRFANAEIDLGIWREMSTRDGEAVQRID